MQAQLFAVGFNDPSDLLTYFDMKKAVLPSYLLYIVVNSVLHKVLWGSVWWSFILFIF